jgi:hypothetical protein
MAYAKDIWALSIPLKVKIFICQLAKGKLPATAQLLQRHGPFDGLCKLCAQGEDVANIFFNCPLARFIWSGIRDMLDVSWNPSSFADMLAIF